MRVTYIKELNYDKLIELERDPKIKNDIIKLQSQSIIKSIKRHRMSALDIDKYWERELKRNGK